MPGEPGLAGVPEAVAVSGAHAHKRAIADIAALTRRLLNRIRYMGLSFWLARRGARRPLPLELPEVGSAADTRTRSNPGTGCLVHRSRILYTD